MLLLAVLLPGPASAARKIFIRDIVLHGSCVKEVSADALRALLAQEMPRDILAHRGLAYEDLSSYLDSTWNAESFTVREARHILNRVRQFDMKMMLWLEVSCVPGPGGRPTYLLTGRLMDLDRMDEILTCQDAQERDQRRVCHGSGDVYDAVTFAQVEMTSFAEFVNSVRHLFARLMHIPEIELSLDTSAALFDPGQVIKLHYSVRLNDSHRDPAIRYVQEVIPLDADQQEQVCQDPARHWDQLTCATAHDRAACPAPVPFQVAVLGRRPVPLKLQKEAGGAQISFRAPDHEMDYVVRAEAATTEGSGEIRSTPVYSCLHVRERKYQIGLTLRWGISIPTGYSRLASTMNSAPDEFVFWWGQPHIGADLSVGYAAIRRRGHLPVIGLALVLGGTYTTASLGRKISLGQNPPELNPLCTRDKAMPPAFDHCGRVSGSWTTEVRGQIQFDLFRWRRIFLRLYGDTGLGIEYLSSDPGYKGDGANAVVLAGIGLSAGGHVGLSPRWDLGLVLGILWQWRFRITATTTVLDNTAGDPFGVPAIPQVWEPLWFTLGLNLESPQRSR